MFTTSHIHLYSIVSRQSPGRPGSRRHQRWINEMQLTKPIDPDELRSLFLVTTESSFSFLWSGNGQAAKVLFFVKNLCSPRHPCFQLMSNFLDVTEEQQSSLLAESESAPRSNAGSRRRQIVGAANKFVQLNAKARDLFRRGVGLNTLADVEHRVIQFLNEAGNHLDCEDMLTPMQRLVAHAVAGFHGCNSRTINRPDGSRAMYATSKCRHK